MGAVLKHWIITRTSFAAARYPLTSIVRPLLHRHVIASLGGTGRRIAEHRIDAIDSRNSFHLQKKEFSLCSIADQVVAGIAHYATMVFARAPRPIRMRRIVDAHTGNGKQKRRKSPTRRICHCYRASTYAQSQINNHDCPTLPFGTVVLNGNGTFFNLWQPKVSVRPTG